MAKARTEVRIEGGQVSPLTGFEVRSRRGGGRDPGDRQNEVGSERVVECAVLARLSLSVTRSVRAAVER